MNLRSDTLIALICLSMALTLGCGGSDSDINPNDFGSNTDAADPAMAQGNTANGSGGPAQATANPADSSDDPAPAASDSTTPSAVGSLMGAMCPEGFTDPCAQEPASDANTICGALVLPANYAGGAVRVSYHFFDSAFWNADTQSPLGPPTVFVWEAIPNGEMTTRETESNADLTAMKACEAYAVRVPVSPEKWAGTAGKSLYVYANVYMPMGGQATWRAKEGIDFVGASSGTITLGDSAVNIEPIILTLQ